jgi:predicted MPP superfamily phosphohydrolase
MMWAWLAMMVVYVGSNGYLYWRVMQSLTALPSTAKVVISILFWIAAFALFIALALRDSSLPASLSHTLFAIGSVWMVFLLYMVLSLALFDILHLFIPALQHRVLYALAITIPLMIYGYINYRMPQTSKITIDIDKPIEGGSYRMVAISDVHLGHGTDRQDLARYVDMINEQNPDVVVIVGDLIDNSITPVIEESMLEEFKRIEARDGIYMVPGNHEYISGIERCAEHITSSGIVLLRDSIVELPSGIQLIGRDDRMNRSRKPIDSLMMRADSSRPTVLLDHQPHDIAQSDRLKVDIHISGHTHRGQVWPLNLATDIIYEQSHGYRKWSHTHAYVSQGVSLWGPPFRIGSKSELLVIDIE